MAREFTFTKGKREQVPLLVGIMGASGSGKTFSAQRLAKGMQRVYGGKIFGLDTEGRRMLHYADMFDFEWCEFAPPFGPLDYLAAIRAAVEQGARIIVCDSTSHMHEGEGGILERHEEELAKLGGRAKDSFRAWTKPKAELQRFINGINQINASFIFCFRAKEKSKPATDEKTGKSELKELGMMPICSPELIYEMTACALLMPNANGVPTWNPQNVGERMMVKQPEQFRELFKQHAGQPLSEDMGEAMARWAQGGEQRQAATKPAEGPFRFPRGDYAGKTLAEAPEGYLSGLLDNDKTPDTLKELIEAELERRMSEEAQGT